MPTQLGLFRLLGICAGLAGLLPQAHAGGNVNVVLESEVVFLDPYTTTANITRTFGFLIYDTLFATDHAGAVHPQMVGATQISDDKLTYNFTLRDGLIFHDGAKVTGEDVVASLKRWAPRDGLGRQLAAATQSMEPTANGFIIRLKEPFPLLLDVLGKPNAIVPFIMPARLVGGPPDQKITEITGSGPFIFRADLWRPGDSMVFDRNPAYVPRTEPPDFLSGGKVVKIDRITQKVIPDVSTAASALLAGEVDYLDSVSFDWVPRLQNAPGIKVMTLGGTDQFQGNYRLNHAFPPFNDPAIRHVLWKLVDQKTVMQAIGIPPALFLPNCPSFFMCGTPLESKAGTEAAGFSIEAAKQELKATNYDGEKVIIMELGNSPTQLNASLVMVDAMRKAGFTVEEQTMDWGTLLQRRVKKEGWSIFAVNSNGTDMSNPLTHFYVGSNCADYPGWSCEPKMQPLMAEFAKAQSLLERRRIADQIQELAYENTPSVMWGQFTAPHAYRTSLSGLLQTAYPLFWQVDKPGK
jgi:peptide/nickel transport system substrate-binding protein